MEVSDIQVQLHTGTIEETDPPILVGYRRPFFKRITAVSGLSRCVA